MDVILASASPRRKELMEMLGIRNLKIRPARGEERPPAGAGPEELVLALASAKAEEVAGLYALEEDVVVAADTVVWIDGRVLGKPHSRQEAAAMLRRLSGRTHQVYTGVCVLKGGRGLSRCERSSVRFRPLSEEEIAAYVATGEPMDKAGAYGAQGLGALFVERIEGDFFNVMGLPLCSLGQMLKQQGVVVL